MGGLGLGGGGGSSGRVGGAGATERHAEEAEQFAAFVVGVSGSHDDDVHADVGLVYCEEVPNPKKYHWVPLFEYALYPVCSPALLEKIGQPVTVDALMTHPLVAIYTEVQNWEAWATSAGADFKPSVPFLMVDTLAVALEMALNGEGIALVNGPFVDQDLASGRLVRPIDHKAVCPGSWGLICRNEMRENLRIRTFMDWVANNVAASGNLVEAEPSRL